MRIVLDSVRIARGEWSLPAEGVFGEGVHLVSGETGSGKSTLALALAGLLGPSSGTIAREGIGTTMLSFQFPEHQLTGLTLGEEVRSWGLDPSAVLPTVALAGKEDLNPLRLSRGELKRLNLACVLAGEHDLLVLDEPFSSLDLNEKGRICRVLSSRERGITVILTHEQTVFPRVDHLWEIREGGLRSLGRVPEALGAWEGAPAIIRELLAYGKVPRNIAPDDLLEAAWRT